MFIDTHCHLTDEVFSDVKSVVDGCNKDDVRLLINAGYNMPSSVGGAELSKGFKEIYFLCGFHPSDAEDFNNETIDNLLSLSRNEKCVGIGEIGLDYHYDGFDKKLQQKVFITQLELAKSLNLPVCIHSRDCTEDMIKILKDNKDKLINGAVMHCFSGSLETAKILWQMDIYTSFSGTLTFKNAKNLIEVAKCVPNDLYLTETDSPYLSPHPFRGETNSPQKVKYVALKLAEIRQQPVEVVTNQIKNNALNLYKKIKL